jgi:AcrR family transcriptional regulator
MRSGIRRQGQPRGTPSAAGVEVASAALRIVDEAGLTALSMRSLAAALGTGPMTMYNYVAGKEGLEELVVASIVAEVSVPPRAATGSAMSMRSPPRCGAVCARTRPPSRWS